jgi:hypothetical protein
MLSNDKIKLLSMADALQIEAEDRINHLNAKISDQNILRNITRAIGSIRATIKKAV